MQAKFDEADDLARARRWQEQIRLEITLPDKDQWQFDLEHAQPSGTHQ